MPTVGGTEGGDLYGKMLGVVGAGNIGLDTTVDNLHAYLRGEPQNRVV